MPTDDAAPEIARRELFRMAGAAAFAVSGVGRLSRQTPSEFAQLVPADKNLPTDWVKSLTARGERTVYRGSELKFIGMPIGGICAGQVFLGGDGRLWLWDIFNQPKFGVVEKTVMFRGDQLSAGGGANYVAPPEQVHPFNQEFVLTIGEGNNRTDRPLDFRGWKDIGFTGEYPVGYVTYADPDEKVTVTLEAFSPFIPLNADDSGLPATVMQYTVTNHGAAPVPVRIQAWLTNPVGLHTIKPEEGTKADRPVNAPGYTGVQFLLRPNPPAPPHAPPLTFDDFESPTYQGWTVTGTAFGPGPIEKSKIPSYQGDVGGHGLRVVNSHNARNGETIAQADAHTGRMVSRPFPIQYRFIEFYIGGGNHPGKTCLNLVVDGAVVRTATGANDNHMRLTHFDVSDLRGKSGHIEIVDEETGPWGNIGIDDIVFTYVVTTDPVTARPDFGTITLALLDRHSDDKVTIQPDISFETHVSGVAKLGTEIARQQTLRPGESMTATFVIAWHFPNLTLPKLGRVGRYYANRHVDSNEVVAFVVSQFPRLHRDTKLWHDTWYDSTLPYWFLDRVSATSATLATATSTRFANGRFYGWEGIGCCEGTCGHVWLYAQAMARLFPELERTVREMVDFGVAFHPDTGIIEFRGEYGDGYATDSQSGYVLRTYREHQMSADAEYLKRVYPRMKKALEYLILQDGKDAGVISNAQHNTLDVDLYGPSSWLTSLYLAALSAGAAMATEMKDDAFARHCRSIFDKGSSDFVDTFWNGEYFVQRPDPAHPEALRYGDGCEIDQVMGQAYAWQLGLGRVIDEDHTKKALAALYRNNFLTDVGKYRDRFKPGRWYATPGEGGLLMCTFPKGDREPILGNRPTWASMYFNECMTGFEYEAAAHMVAEGLVTEGMAVTRTIHDRYYAAKRNPWNEVECSDHYARCMAAHGVFIAACGFEHHGPNGHIGFAPRITPEDFRAPFTCAEGWGTYSQKLGDDGLRATIELKHGQLSLSSISLDLPKAASGQTATIRLGKANLPVESKRTESGITLSIPNITLHPTDRLEMHVL